MYFDEVMQKFREVYKKNKETKAYLVHDDNGMIVEFFPQLEDELIQYHIVKDSDIKRADLNNTVGYVDHLNTDLLLSNNWSFCEEE